MEKIIIKTDGNPFIVHIVPDGDMKLYGSVYFAEEYLSLKDDSEGIAYQNGNDYLTNEPSEDTKRAFDFSFCWRGVWEGRIYFKEAEYWSEDLEAMNSCWNELENIIKEKIKQNNPNYKYFD